MVEWLAPTFNQHKKRLFGAVRASHQSELFLNKMREKHEAGKYPEFIDTLVAPKALDGLPSLQPLWDQVHSQYKENLYQALLNSRQDKLATQYSPAIRDEIIKSLVADTKKLIADKSAADPAHQSTFEAEGKAAFSLFTSSTTHWEQEAKEQALNHFQRQKAIREANEGQALDQANVSLNYYISSNLDTYNPLDPISSTSSTARAQIPPLSSKRNSSQRQGQRDWGLQGDPKRQPQGCLQRKRNNQGKRNVKNLLDTRKFDKKSRDRGISLSNQSRDRENLLHNHSPLSCALCQEGDTAQEMTSHYLNLRLHNQSDNLDLHNQSLCNQCLHNQKSNNSLHNQSCDCGNMLHNHSLHQQSSKIHEVNSGLHNHDLHNHDLSNHPLSNHDLSNHDLSNHNPSNQTISNHNSSNHDLSNHMISNHNASNQDLSNHALSNHDLSNHALSNPDPSNHALSNHALSNHALSNHALSNHALSNHALSNHALSNHALSNHTLSNHASSNHALSNHALSNHALSNQTLHNPPTPHTSLCNHPLHKYTQNTHKNSPNLSKNKSKNRRLSKAHKNRIKQRDIITHDLKDEQAELNLMKSNLRQIGVAQKLVHNLTGKIIPPGALNCLALGTKFISVPKSKQDILPLSIKSFRRTIRIRHLFQDDNNENNIIPKYWIPSSWNPPFLDQRRDIEITLNSLQNSIKPNTTPIIPNINKSDIKQYNNLLHDQNIVVILADKNLGYAVVTKSWYIEKCLEHLNSNSYIDVTQHYQNALQSKPIIDLLVDSLADLVIQYQHVLDTDEIKWILQKPKIQWQPMKFYITAKVHKKPIKGRPIVPSMTWMTFHLSQWLANQLNPLLPATQWVLKDSYDLLAAIKNINNLNLPNTIRIASADVEALYPSMDINTGLQLVKQFIEDLNWGNSSKREFLLKAMQFVLTKGYITFQNQIYQQTNGAAMGSPMIPPYANIFMYQLEKHTVQKYTNSGTLILYKRFIDDVFIIIKDSNITQVQNELNSLNPSIKLTWTPPAKHCNFLDMNISIKNNKLHTSVYQKQLNTYAYLPFHSYHTTAQKRGFIKGEAIRYARICTSEADFKLMVNLFTLRLQRRGYPLSFIQRSLGQVQHKNRHNYTVLSNSTKNKNKVIPLLFKTEYNPIVSHHNLRTALNQFTANIIKLANVHPSISQKVTICYKMPPKLHKLSLKARKRKGL